MEDLNAIETEIKVDSGVLIDSGHYISISSDSDTLYFNPELWPLIKGQVDSLMNKLVQDQELITASEMPALKACPFCGSKAETFKERNRLAGHGESSDEAGVECSGCGVLFSERNYSGYQEEERIKEAKRKWNARAETN